MSLGYVTVRLTGALVTRAQREWARRPPLPPWWLVLAVLALPAAAAALVAPLTARRLL